MKFVSLFFVLFLAILCIPACGGKPSKSAAPALGKSAALFISAKGGLWMRNAPDASGEKVVILPYRAEVKSLGVTNDIVVIGGVSGKWTKIEWRGSTGFAFGGFLTDVRPPEPPAVKSEPGEPPYDLVLFNTVLDKTFVEDLPPDQQMDSFSCVIRYDGSYESEQLLGGSGSDKVNGIWSVIMADGGGFNFRLQGMTVRRVVAEQETVTKSEFNEGVVQITLSNGVYWMSTFEIPNGSFGDRKMSLVN